jgi:OCT family organic cation transporter-like MFS transporter 4/5
MKMVEILLAIGILPYFFYWFLLPESPRWLIARGRMAEARDVLSKALATNDLPAERIELLDTIQREETREKYFFTDLVKYPATRRNLICMSFSWFTISMGYYGLIYNTPSFDWNLYVTHAIPPLLTMGVVLFQPWKV